MKYFLAIMFISCSVYAGETKPAPATPQPDLTYAEKVKAEREKSADRKERKTERMSRFAKFV